MNSQKGEVKEFASGYPRRYRRGSTSCRSLPGRRHFRWAMGRD
jgi:hypothetical protein